MYDVCDPARPAWYAVRYGTSWCGAEGSGKVCQDDLDSAEATVPRVLPCQVLAVARGAWRGHNNPGPEWLYTTAAIRRTNKQLDVHGGTLFSP